MAKLKDITGQRFGRLVAVRFDSWYIYPSGDKRAAKWLFNCDCGDTVVAFGSNVIRGVTRSCGCLSRKTKTTHGESCTDSFEYTVWCSMRYRCLNPDQPDYGGRGIKICSQWDAYETFLQDMGRAPSRKHTIDRINNNGDYSPENCHWATRKEQVRNTRRNRWITHNGETLILQDWADRLGIRPQNILCRLNQGWTLERALTEPPRRYVTERGRSQKPQRKQQTEPGY